MNFLSKTPPSEQFELSPIKAMELAASRVPDMVSLAQGIPSFRTPERVIGFAQEKIAAGLCDKYSLTTGLTELREEIALSLETEGLSYDPEREILVTAGSIEGITATMLAFTSPGDEVLLPSPSYASYLGAISIAGCVPRYVELDEENNFDFQVEKIKQGITKKTKLLLYCSPNNPTGTLFSQEKTRELVEICRQHNLTILIDEVYKDFYYVDEPHFSATQIPEARGMIVRACSFSKAYAMTGWRVGFVHADKDRISRIVKFHDAMVTCAPVPAQYAAIGALRYGAEFLEEFRVEFKKRRNYCISRLDELSQVMDYQLPKATYFVFPRIKDIVEYAGDSHRLAYDILDKVKVATVPGVAFGPSGESHLRINFGREMSDLEEGFDRLEQYFFHRQPRQRPRKVVAEQARVITPLPGKAGTSPSWSGKGARLMLAHASRRYLKRNPALVIGITGIKGKTTIKRTLVELLGICHHTRGAQLSYNTEVGLPLSILGLKNPKTVSEKIGFPLLLTKQALWGWETAEVLILEYGIRSLKDAEILLNIAVPDWLIISGVEADPHLDYKAICKGIKYIAASLEPEKLLCIGDDPFVSSMEPVQQSPHVLHDNQLADGQLSTSKNNYACGREIVGTNAARALIAAVTMAELLSTPAESIRSFLQG
ncbi:aminotransferase class I/II-fold pyridoxal phosphate-dependent enzyme [Desulfogranum marinum]|uniref:aminotransferase class I/II-fold pyridoxal phosphate-dependent enzyme n=1 Tax=Desulfogranum marinum TaxID=453220 RepID=UPI001966B4C4|nr:aminotransferase class I/II-fold pyridoxal phosphate-dependent enzyme [Desulfogranum marinum]MBM9511276.1 aminotransferase class I/II-fold pyridoxal phosphate-dependent enzyme [Desulfogranum marinum]